jgi:L-aspartate oxidase
VGTRALVAAVHALPGVEVRERWFSEDLVIDRERCTGVRAVGPDGATEQLRATHTVLATGGAGQMFAVTTNPALSTGDGVAMATRAAAAVADVEFVQFHPTALHHPVTPRPLLSEALRGDGAVLRDERGVAFMAEVHPLADLAPRDVVSRAMMRRLLERGLAHLWLDATTIDDFPRRFPTIWRATRAAGLDPTEEWLPVAPAAHYQCGGVATDLDGATTVPGLWACGEVACSGVHGANRLGSNSLLDGLVFGPRVVDAIERGKAAPDETGVLRGVTGRSTLTGPSATPSTELADEPGPGGAPITLGGLQDAMTAHAGVLRDESSLHLAAGALRGAVHGTGVGASELRNLVTVARALVRNALARAESRGTHTRLDFPDTSAAFLGRFVAGRAEPAFAALPSEVRAR